MQLKLALQGKLSDVMEKHYSEGAKAVTLTLVITDIHVDCYKITATARMMDIGNKSFPSENYTVKNYPGLTR